MPLHALLVEDSEADAFLILRELNRGGFEPVHERVENASEMSAALAKKTFDVVLADYVMPQFNGIEALALMKSKGLDLPFIIISGKIGENTAVEAMKAGAHDYIMKDNLKRLAPAIKRELEQASLRQERKISQEKLEEGKQNYRCLAESISDVFLAMDSQLRCTYWNKACESLTGVSARKVLGRHFYEIFADAEIARKLNVEFVQAIVTKQPRQMTVDYNLRDKTTWLAVTVYPAQDGLSVFAKDITRRKQTEQNLAEKSRQLEARVNELQAVNNFNIKLINERAEFISRQQRRIEQLKRLHKVAKKICSSTSLAECLDSIIKHFSEVVDADFASVFLVKPDGQIEIGVNSYDFGVPLAKVGTRGSIIRDIISTAQPTYLPNYATDPRHNATLVARGVRTWTGIPLINANRVRGLLIASSLKENAFAYDTEVMQAFADWAAQALRHVETAAAEKGVLATR